PEGRSAYAERFREVASEMSWEQALGPLLRFCADPHLAADRVVEAPQVDFSRIASRGAERGRRDVSLFAPAPPSTPLWQLPARWPDDSIGAIDVRFGTYMRRNAGAVTLQLRRAPDERDDLRTVVITASELSDNALQRFRLDPPVGPGEFCCGAAHPTLIFSSSA